MPKFITCWHPDLPGQTADLPSPRNGWKPVKNKRTKTSRRDKPARTDSPAAGESITTNTEEE